MFNKLCFGEWHLWS